MTFCSETQVQIQCKSMMHFILNSETIKENCKFKFYCNKTDITPTVLDGRIEIILAKWPNDKHIICNINNDIPNHLYVLVNRSVFCYCGIKVKIILCLKLIFSGTE